MTELRRVRHMVGSHGVRVMVFCLAAVAAGCGKDSANATAIVRDSSGVNIVESRVPEWSDGPGWRVADSPILAIGAADGSPEYQFHRVEGVLRLEHGGVVVADGGSSEIRCYDRFGEFRTKSGGQGDAPGEFRSISGIGAGPGDSLWVFDFGNRRFTVLTNACEPVRSISVGGNLSAVDAVGRLKNGSFVVKEGWGSATGGVGRTGLTRDPVAVAIFAPDGIRSDTLGMFPGREVYVSLEDGRGVMSTPLFAHNTSAVTWEDAVFVGDQETMEIGLYSGEGTLLRLLSVPDLDLHLSAGDIEDHTRQLLEQQPVERRAQARSQLDGMDVPDSRPAYGRLLVGADGSLWAGEHTRYPAIPRAWTVFDPGGRLLGEVAMPERFTLFQIGIDWVLGVGLDDLDVEYVRLYRLEK